MNRNTIIALTVGLLLEIFMFLKPTPIEGHVSFKDMITNEQGEQKMVIRVEYEDKKINDYTANEYTISPNYWDTANQGDGVKVSKNFFNTKVIVLNSH